MLYNIFSVLKDLANFTQNSFERLLLVLVIIDLAESCFNQRIKVDDKTQVMTEVYLDV